MKEIYEKAGLFYLGKDVDRDSFETLDALTLLKNKNFTTHAAIIGMTGSGKTGLGIDIIEEAAIDNIPSIVIDPKGDMGNLLLIDSKFDSVSFEPWVKDDAESKGEDVSEYAASAAKFWKKGIESWNQDINRVDMLERVKKTIYTPGSSAGIPINIVSSLQMPDVKIVQDNEIFSSYLKSSVMGLLSLVGIEADPLDSKEYILLSNIISKAWMNSRNLNLEQLVAHIINPRFKKIGVLTLENFYPSKDRFKLATKFNAVIASPNFSNWLVGESLDIQKLLYDENGKAKIAIFSIAHLNDDERMFFVTLLLNKYIAWMRMQSGSNHLRTLLYMDEIYGFFPPTKNPPSKEPMLTLLKQARAYGVGVVLSTQNPVDLDYKGLSNIGTWFIGRLQTRQDVDKVIDGLGGKIDSSFEVKEIESLLTNLKKRTFFLKSVYLDDIRLFGTRWAISYLKGPLKRDEISKLMKSQKSKMHLGSVVKKAVNKFENVNTLDADIKQYYEIDSVVDNKYHPYLAGKSKVYYFDQKRGIDETKEQFWYLDIEDIQSVDWADAKNEIFDFTKATNEHPKDASYAPVPECVATDNELKNATSDLEDFLYQQNSLSIYKCRFLRLESDLGVSEGEFRVEIQNVLDEKKEDELEKLKDKFDKREQRLLAQLKRANERIEKEKGDQLNSILNVGASILGALFGRTTATKISRTVSKGSRALKESGDVSRAEEKAQEIEDRIYDLGIELDEKIDELSEKYEIGNCEIEPFSIKPKKRDIDVETIGILWRGD